MTQHDIRSFLTNKETPPLIELLHQPTQEPPTDKNPCEQTANHLTNATGMTQDAPQQDGQDQEHDVQQLLNTGRLVLTETQDQGQERPPLHAPECDDVWEKMMQLWSKTDGLVQQVIAHAQEDPHRQYQQDGNQLGRMKEELLKLEGRKDLCKNMACTLV